MAYFSKMLLVAGCVWVLSVSVVLAQSTVQNPNTNETDMDPAVESSESAEPATPAASLVRKITEKSSDITETAGEAQGKLEQLVLEKLDGQLRLDNGLRWMIRTAVLSGVPANTIVLILMFPVVTAMIAASRHLIGLRGFGIFTPAVVAVGFLATGITAGFALFFVIITVATAARMMIRRLKMPYLPRTSLMIWFVSLAVLLILLTAPYLGLEGLAKLSIFPILLMVLLAETFIEVQTRRSRSQAVEMTIETLLLAVLSYFVMNLEIVQSFVLINPELVMLSVALFNVFLGKFHGLRLMEYWRFRELMK